MAATIPTVAPEVPGRRPERRPRVLLAGFEPLFARLLYNVLRESSLVEVVPANVRGREAEAALGEHQPASLLLCWESLDAVQLQRLAQTHPDVGIVVLSHTLSAEQARALLRCGAVAALERRVSRPVLVAAMVLASTGLKMEPRATTGEERGGLSEREAEVLGLLECGESLTVIAQLLGVSRQTVKTQARSIYRKLGVHSRAELREQRRDRAEDTEECAVLRVDCLRGASGRARPGWMRAPLGRRSRWSG